MHTFGATSSSLLLSIRAITGCDTIGKFNGIFKESWFKGVLENGNIHEKLKDELAEFQITENIHF